MAACHMDDLTKSAMSHAVLQRTNIIFIVRRVELIKIITSDIAESTMLSLTDSDHLLMFSTYGLPILFLMVTIFSVFAKFLYPLLLSNSNKSATEHKANGLFSENERKMDFFEMIMDEFHSNGGGNICCGLRLKSQSSLGHCKVREALESIARKYASLRTVVVKKKNDGNETKFLRIHPDVKVSLHQPDVDEDDWKNVWQNEIQKLFDCEKGPLWRTVLLKERYNPLNKTYHNTLLFTFYHGTIDGVSIYKFSQEFCACLETEEKHDKVVCQVVPQSMMTLLAPLQFIHYKILQWILPSSMLVYLVKLSMRFNVLLTPKNPVTSKYSKNIAGQGSEVKMISRQLTSSNTEKLIKLCRRNRCTVHGAILACCHLAVQKLVQSTSRLDVSWYCPVNVRAQCSLDYCHNTLGSYTTILAGKTRVPRISMNDFKGFWKFSKQCSQTVHSGIRRGRHLYSLYLLPIAHLLCPKEFFSEFLSNQTESPVFCLTNLGKIGVKNDGVYQIESVFGGMGAYRHGATFKNQVATFNGVFMWSTTYSSGKVDDEVAEEYVKNVFEILHNVLESNEQS